MALHLKWFTFNPFSENTYILYADNKDCIIIDPGCADSSEEQLLRSFIQEKKLNPIRLILTHAHIDHILGVSFVHQQYQLKPELHQDDLELYNTAGNIARMYGISYKQGPQPAGFLLPSSELLLENQKLEIIHAPGHSPGSVCFYQKDNQFLIGGDVLFYESVGRTDLPGGSFETLANSIKTKLYALPESTRVFSGHGSSTTIGYEKVNNPFVKV